MKRRSVAVLAAVLTAAPWAARADAVDTLRTFSREVRSGKASFTQTVTSPDGKRTKTSSGDFEFARPDRFRFAYTRPFEQLIVGDGHKVWIYDADLQQASSRRLSQALGATPAALLAGAALERDFDLQPLPARDGLEWVAAVPKVKDGAFQSLAIGFRGGDLAAVDVVDGFGQRSALRFGTLELNPTLRPERFQFKPPAGVEVLEQ
jgi:outer membrane lipoprotein carrier protein